MALFASSLVFYGSLNLVGLPILAATTAIIWFAAIRVQGVQDAQSAWLEANKRTANREQKKEKKRLFLRQQRVWLVGKGRRKPEQLKGRRGDKGMALPPR